MAWFKKRSGNGAADAQKCAQDNLYLLLDQRYHECLLDEKVWRRLEALDAGLVAGSMRMEPFDPKQMVSSERNKEHAQEKFTLKQPTLVFGMRTKAQAKEAALLLNRLMVGCQTQFHAEPAGDGTYQVRTNIDKQHWDKLTVLCQYRFDREIPEAERHRHTVCAQRHIHDYTRGTDAKDWKALSGVPAFITLMGLPGILRPAVSEAIDSARKQREFSEPSPLGVPALFRGVPVHVELKSGQGGVFDSYSYGYLVDLAALDKATDGKTPKALLLETIGGNPFEKNISPTSRVCRVLGMTGWVSGAAAFTPELLDVVGVFGCGVGTVVFVTGAWANYRYKLLDQLASLKQNTTEQSSAAVIEHSLSREQGRGQQPKLQEKSASDSARDTPEVGPFCAVYAVERIAPISHKNTQNRLA